MIFFALKDSFILPELHRERERQKESVLPSADALPTWSPANGQKLEPGA